MGELADRFKALVEEAEWEEVASVMEMPISTLMAQLLLLGVSEAGHSHRELRRVLKADGSLARRADILMAKAILEAQGVDHFALRIEAVVALVVNRIKETTCPRPA